MEEKLNKYADLLLKRCLSIKKGQPLYILAPMENINFIRILTSKALELGVTDIYYDLEDSYIRHEELKYLSIEELVKRPYFNKSSFDEYAKKNAAFLMLYSDDPDLMSDIDSDKLMATSKVSRESRPIYRKKQRLYEVPWCIACTSTLGLAKKIFKDSDNPVVDLWNIIFKICLIDEEDPIKAWDNKVIENSKMTNILNKLQFRELHYTNSLGTDLKVELPVDHIWCGAGDMMPDGTHIFVNMPTEEVFTTPIFNRTEGIVYSSKPLVYNGSLIEDFYIEFKDGKVVNFDAKKGKDILEGIINGDKTSCYLGEVALVNYHSPISESNILFYETLYDENASCHLALGEGFSNCIKDGAGKTNEELETMGINSSTVHVDFMMGTKDLNILGTTYTGKTYQIFKDGDFVLKED